MRKRTWMISFASTALSFALLSNLVFANARTEDDPQKQYQEDKPEAASTHKSAFACDRRALDPVARKRHFDELGPALRSLRKAVRELPDGYEFEFASDPKTVAIVTEWAVQERVCCPFFNIQLRMEAEGGPVWLRLTGRKGTKEFIQADGAVWIRQ